MMVWVDMAGRLTRPLAAPAAARAGRGRASLMAASGLYFSAHCGWLVHQVGRGLVNAGITAARSGIDLSISRTGGGATVPADCVPGPPRARPGGPRLRPAHSSRSGAESLRREAYAASRLGARIPGRPGRGTGFRHGCVKLASRGHAVTPVPCSSPRRTASGPALVHGRDARPGPPGPPYLVPREARLARLKIAGGSRVGGKRTGDVRGARQWRAQNWQARAGSRIAPRPAWSWYWPGTAVKAASAGWRNRPGAADLGAAQQRQRRTAPGGPACGGSRTAGTAARCDHRRAGAFGVTGPGPRAARALPAAGGQRGHGAGAPDRVRGPARLGRRPGDGNTLPGPGGRREGRRRSWRPAREGRAPARRHPADQTPPPAQTGRFRVWPVRHGRAGPISESAPQFAGFAPGPPVPAGSAMGLDPPERSGG